MDERLGMDAPGGPPLDVLREFVFEHGTEAMVISRPADAIVLYANDPWCALMGYEPHEVIGRSALELGLWGHPDERVATLAPIRRGVASDTIVLPFRRKDGELRIGEVKARAIQVEGQELLLGSIRDITDRVALEDDLRRGRAQLAAAQAVARVGSWTWDAGTGRTVWSDEMRRLLGLDPDELGGTLETVIPALLDHVHQDDRAAVRAWMTGDSQAGDPRPIEHRLVDADGGIRWVHAESRIQLDDQGAVVGIVGTVQDITERVHADEERRRLLSELVAVREEERERIAVDIHDDALQSLAAALLQTQLLLEGGAQTEATRRLVQIERTLRETIARLRRLTFALRPPSLDRDRLGVALEELAHEQLLDTGILAYVEEPAAGDLPEQTRTVAYRIVQEAIGNVRRHSRARSVWVALEADAAALHVTVADDGIGIDPGVTDQDVRRHRGVSAMRQRAELEGGRLEIGPRPGGGTRVEFWLPLRPASEG